MPADTKTDDIEPPAFVLAKGLAQVEAVVRGWPSPPTTPGLVQGGVAGLDVVFGTTGNAAAATRTGWSVPEPGYHWSVGDRSEMVLPPCSGQLLLIELAPFVAPRLPAQRISIFTNGTPVAAFLLSEHAVVSVALPDGSGAPGQPLTLVFLTPDAAKPVEQSGFPDDRVLAFSFRRMLVKPLRTAPLATPAGALPDAADLPRDALLARFESLGENCEFGLVQRRCGAEPLGLLRFASAPMPKLRAALRADFAGMGQADHLSVQPTPGGRDYMVHDSAFGFAYHAWANVDEQSEADILAREAKRVPFLIRKLLEDLRIGEKIFVYHGMTPLTLDNALDLQADIARHGPATLLWVEVATPGEQPGQLGWAAPGLLKGTIDRFAPGEDAQDSSFDIWIELCRRSVAAVDALIAAG